MARPKGSSQTKPTKSDVLDYYKALKRKARVGDANACGWLLHLEQRQAQSPGPEFLTPWQVTVDGKPHGVMLSKATTRSEAQAAAALRWPTKAVSVEPYEHPTPTTKTA